MDKINLNYVQHFRSYRAVNELLSVIETNPGNNGYFL
jgi:hypothetical protein